MTNKSIARVLCVGILATPLWAELKDDLEELASTNHYGRQQELIASITTSLDKVDRLRELTSIKLRFNQYESILGSLLNHDVIYSDHTFSLLLRAALDAHETDYLDEDAISSKPAPAPNTFRFAAEGAARNRKFIDRWALDDVSSQLNTILRTTPHLFTTSDDFTKAAELIGWPQLFQENRALLAIGILQRPSLESEVQQAKLPGSGDVTDKLSAQNTFLQFVLRKNNWLRNYEMVLNLLDGKSGFKNYLLNQTLIQKQLRTSNLRDLPVSLLFTTKNTENQIAFDGKLREALAGILKDRSLSFDARVPVFEEIIKTLTDKMATDPSYQPLLLACIKFISDEWFNMTTFLTENRSNLSLLRFVDVPRPTRDIMIKSLIAHNFTVRVDEEKMSWLYHEVFQRLVIDFLDDKQPGASLKNRTINYFLPLLYQHELENVAKMVFSDLPKIDAQGNEKMPTLSGYKVICNQDGYDDGVEIKCIKGRALNDDDGTPIGYNVHLPRGNAKAIFTRVYGGFRKHDRLARMSKPNGLTLLERSLLERGFAVATLNLLDLRELVVHQSRMTKDFDRRVQRSINKFFTAMRLGALDPALTHLSCLPHFLAGGSFGGRTTIKHAEIYPRTFSGYISIDGNLSFSILEKTRADIVSGKGTWNNPDIDAYFGIENIQDPVLVLHNFDDNNVNVAVSLGWYKHALRLGKGDLVRMLITHKGNPIPRNVEDIHNKGHYEPEDARTLAQLSSTIERFMLDGALSLPQKINEQQANEYQLYAYRNMNEASATKKFLSEAYRHYKANGSVAITDEEWRSYYTPLFYAVSSLTRLKSQQQPVDMELSRLKENGLLTDDVISRGLKAHAATFVEYIDEKYASSLNLDLQILTISLMMDQTVRSTYRSWILDGYYLSKDFRNYILRTLYVGNPQLLSDYFSYFNDQPSVQEELKHARKKLEEKIRLQQ